MDLDKSIMIATKGKIICYGGDEVRRSRSDGWMGGAYLPH
jgi:hypothetical protein